ncbi:MAG TPA: hypothetical protein VMS88_07235, partial [Terriglobales bacterium]|nr:hypothetical protein [Terriglobales bacterium]
RAGFEVWRRRTWRTPALDSTGVLMLAEVPAEDSSDVMRAGALAKRMVVVLEKWRGEPSARLPRGVGAIAMLSPREVLAPLRALGIERPVLLRLVNGPRACSGARGGRLAISLEPAQLLKPAPGLVPVVTCDSLILVGRLEPAPDSSGAHRSPARSVIVVSDPDLWNNQGLGRADHAALLRALLVDDLGARTVVIDETLHGYLLTRNLIAESLRFPLVLAVAQALLLAAFVVWSGVRRFGKPCAPRGAEGGNRSLIDMTAKLLELTRQTPETLRLYYAQTLQALADRFCLPAGLDEPRLAERLDDIGRARGVEPEAVRTGHFIRSLRVSAASDNPEVAVDLALRLHRWREEITHEP